MIIAPTEPPSLRALGDVNMYPEAHGCDVLFVARKQQIGIQRKEIKDLFASVEDGRLKRQMDMMGQLHASYLIVEGAPRFTLDGEIMGRQYGRRWNRDGYTGVLVSCANRGVKVMHSKDLDDTIRLCLYLEAWHMKETHSLIDGGTRTSMSKLWGKDPTHREWGCHFLEGLPSVGPKTAKSFYDTLGIPLSLTVTEAELRTVDGIGPKIAKRIVRAFSGTMKPREILK